jgi:hypothetical protein
VDLTSLQGATTGLEGWVLIADTQLRGEVLRKADLVFTEINYIELQKMV